MQQENTSKRSIMRRVAPAVRACLILAFIHVVPLSRSRAIAFAKAELRKTMTNEEIDNYDVYVTRKGLAWQLLFDARVSPYLGNHFMVHVYTRHNMRIVPGR